MAQETKKLAEYAAGLRFEDLPEPVIQRAKDCIADTVATIAFGADLPWSRMIVGLRRARRAPAAAAASLRPAARGCRRRWRRSPTARWRTPSSWTT